MRPIVLALLLAFAAPAFGADVAKEKGPCMQISNICKGAGFTQGEWKEGDGLMRDCVNPIIQGITTVPGATKPLPAVDAKLVADCKAKRPKFGTGKVGSIPKAAKK